MPHPADRRPASTVVEGKHVDDHILFELPVLFTKMNKPSADAMLLFRHYENGEMTFTITGDAIRKLERRDPRGPIGK